jgi:hypothetical protein
LPEEARVLNGEILLAAIISLSTYLVTIGGEKNWDNTESWVYQLCNYKHNKLDEIRKSDFDQAVYAKVKKIGPQNTQNTQNLKKLVNSLSNSFLRILCIQWTTSKLFFEDFYLLLAVT